MYHYHKNNKTYRSAGIPSLSFVAIGMSKRFFQTSASARRHFCFVFARIQYNSNHFNTDSVRKKQAQYAKSKHIM